jgi:hypothetical protein
MTPARLQRWGDTESMSDKGTVYGPRVGIVGSRDFPSPHLIAAYVASLPASAVVISGGAQGVDTWAEAAARERGLAIEVFHADWKRLGRKAGPIRNGQIVKASDRIVAFWNVESRGTLNTIVQAHRAGLPIEIFGSAGEAIPIEMALAAAEERGIVRSIQRATEHKRRQE